MLSVQQLGSSCEVQEAFGVDCHSSRSCLQAGEGGGMGSGGVTWVTVHSMQCTLPFVYCRHGLMGCLLRWLVHAMRCGRKGHKL